MSAVNLYKTLKVAFLTQHGKQTLLRAPLEAARKKALIGIASEGSFGMDPFGGFIPWNTEVVAWIDQKRLRVDQFADPSRCDFCNP